MSEQMACPILTIRVSWTKLDEGYDENPLRWRMQHVLGAAWASTNRGQGTVEFALREGLSPSGRSWLERLKLDHVFINYEVTP